ncbi:MAG: efflux RND transporter permease subunit [Silvibacterium sp.]
MWIVRFAQQRPYTFVIVAVLIAIFGITSVLKTPTDILPDIDIPIASFNWTYSGLDADDMSKRIIAVCERALPTTANNIEYTESQSYSGVGVIKADTEPGPRDGRLPLLTMKFRMRSTPALSACVRREKVIELRARTD